MECPDIDLRSALDLRAVHRRAMRGASTDPEVDAAVRHGVCLAARPLILRERFFSIEVGFATEPDSRDIHGID